MTINNKGNLFVFEVGPSVKFVSAIKDAIFNKKMGLGEYGKRPDFFRILICAPFPYVKLHELLLVQLFSDIFSFEHFPRYPNRFLCGL